MGFFQSRLLTLVIVILFSGPAWAQQSMPAIRFQFFPDSNASLNVVSLTLGQFGHVLPQEQAAIHLLEHAVLHLPQSAFDGLSLQKRLERKGARCETEIRYHAITIKAASTTATAAEMLTDMMLALELDSIPEAEVKKIMAAILEESDRAAELPGWLLDEEVNARLCKLPRSCVSVMPTPALSTEEARQMLAAGWQKIIPGAHCLVSVKGPLSESEIRGLAENGLGAQLRREQDLHSIALQPPDRNQYFTLLNENAIVPEMQLTWLVRHAPGADSATAWVAARALEARMSDLPFLPFESCRSEVRLLNGSSLVTLHLVPQALRIPALADSLPALLRIWLNTEKWTDALIDRARASLRIRRDLGAMNPFWFPLPPDSLLQGIDRVSRDEVMAFVQQQLQPASFIAGLSLNSAVDAITGAEELFARANDNSPDVRDLNPVSPRPDTPAVIAMNPPVDLSQGMEEAVSQLKKIRIYFEPNSSQPDAASIQALHKVGGWMKSHADWRLFVNGYADSRGDGVKNYQLTIERASAIKQWLVTREGVKSDRLIVRPWGEAFPEFEETSPENIRRNRRVTFDPASADEPVDIF